MRGLLLTAVLLAGCSSAEQRVVKAGGADPVVCFDKSPYRVSGLVACRDSASQFWICNTDSDYGCMPVDGPKGPAEVFRAWWGKQ